MFIQPRSEADHKNVIEQGFTLVELLIVIVILGILAGIVVFAVGGLTKDATANSCKTDAATFNTAFQAYKAHNSGAVPGVTGGAATAQRVMDELTDTAAVGQKLVNNGGPYLQNQPATFATTAAAGKFTITNLTTGATDASTQCAA